MNPTLNGLAANPALPPDLLDRLIALAVSPAAGGGEDGLLGSELAGRKDLARDQVLALAAHDEGLAVTLAYRGRLHAADVDPLARPAAAIALLEEGRGLPQWPCLLAACPDAALRAKLAACPGLPPEVTAVLAADPELDVVTELALFATPNPTVAARLAAHPHAEVRRAAAANPGLPPDLLAALLTGEGLPPAASCLVCDREPTPFVHDPYCPRTDCDLRGGAACDGSHRSTEHDTRWAALENPATPAEAVALFTADPSSSLRQAVAARTGLPGEVYARLARDPVPGVRWAVAGNPSIDEALIRELATGRDPEVLRGLARHPRLPLDVLSGLAGGLRAGAEPLPRIAAAPATEVEELAASAQPGVRMLVAQRRDLPPGVRDALAADPDEKVVGAVAAHPGLAPGLLRAMVARHGVRIHAQVAANPDVPADLLEELVRHDPPLRGVLRTVAGHPRATAAALRTCLTDGKARLHAAAHPALPAGELRALLDDPDWQVAEAAAAHPALPVSLMRELARFPAPAEKGPNP
ncbi:hypothetical protein [Streptomyces sp. NBC_00091]|uniref:hypothetical protein n=1 Tax=Streptomyces sp. NBC_00091 TaxID=2975648 RepID=UPI002250C0C7|nr:hypothetical protein [Streptomyces sp. NBC_00091]MCX5380032.1 DUF2336 domain-containing protein [Streptomyces sp. NBC_00091]